MDALLGLSVLLVAFGLICFALWRGFRPKKMDRDEEARQVLERR